MPVLILQRGIFLVVHTKNTLMKSLRIFLVLVSFCTFLLAGQADAKAQNTPLETIEENTKFSLGLGKCQKMEGVKITFLEVLQDSRCPKDVDCVWAGQAKIKIRIKEKGKAAFEQEILFDGSGKEIVIYSSETVAIKAISLSPEPITSIPKKDRAYNLEVSM